ncbi:Gfo/Idh/MocA family protein [Wenxinia saemankumensis]|uniref:Predicted dehydrogenase n=1 Tax=Wenxinia saemankumensis TaxID=1447782 RepID=A0A1M6CZZ5_9RHOB|nr:Gfo/Idh/MocA family oxidoreductase [Wenxinia saemankumensis]SHI66577.1 Predicted dehydrogenase [Wenxinia saemankumensis]
MTGRLRIAVIGLGARSRTWLKVLSAHPGVIVTGLADPSAEARHAAGVLFPDAATAPDAAALARTAQADAAILVTPPGGRAAQIDACLAAGWDILAEKPLADSVAEAARFVARAEAAGRQLLVGLNFRYLPVTRAYRAALDEGRVGAPEFGRFLYERWRDGRLPHLNRYPLQMDHPMLWEQSVHHFDLMRHVYRREPLRIDARTWNPSWSMYRGHANVSALIEFEGGMHVTYQGTWAGGVDRLDFDWRTDCTNGVLIQREMMGGLVAATRQGEFAPVETAAHEPWITDAAALLDMAVRAFTGTGPAECTGRDHLSSLLMLEACIRSSDRGGPVELAELHDETTSEEHA